MSDPDNGTPPSEDVRRPALQKAERSDNWFMVMVKVLFFLALGTVLLGVLLFGTCVLLMRH